MLEKEKADGSALQATLTLQPGMMDKAHLVQHGRTYFFLNVENEPADPKFQSVRTGNPDVGAMAMIVIVIVMIVGHHHPEQKKMGGDVYHNHQNLVSG